MESLELDFSELFYADAYRTDFNATVLSCRPLDKSEGFAVLLDNTLFYPEGGGQPADRGTLGEAEVFDVQRVSDGILHYVNRPLAVNEQVEGKIDWARRFDFMQQHSAEHIISGLVKQIHGYENVGFHMNETEMTLDLSGPLTARQVEEIETKANAAVWQNLPLQVDVYPEATDDELPDYRSKMELNGNLRLITVEGYDVCACCGTHLRTTGEIGSVKIIDSVAHRGGTRLTALCGGRALQDAQLRWKQSRKIGALLSAPSDNLLPYVERTLEQLSEEQSKSLALQKRLNEYALESIPQHTGNLFTILSDRDVNNAKYLGKKVSEKINGVAMVFFPHPREEGFMYIITAKEADVQAVQSRLKDKLKLRGGGNQGLIQGITQASAQEIVEACSDFAYQLEI